MSRSALLAALEEETARQLAARRARAEAEADALRAAADATCQARLATITARQQSAAAELQRRGLAQARQECRRLTLVAEAELATRLRQLAVSELAALGAHCAEDCLRTLAAELPPLAWATVRVAVRDAALARQLFPNAEVLTDPQLSGGLIAATAGQRIVVDNSLEKRLERCWDDLLPRLLAALEAGHADPAAPS